MQTRTQSPPYSKRIQNKYFKKKTINAQYNKLHNLAKDISIFRHKNRTWNIYIYILRFIFSAELHTYVHFQMKQSIIKI